MHKLFAALLAFGLLCGTAHAAKQTQRIVVVISLDGFPAYFIQDPRLPIPTLRMSSIPTPYCASKDG
jgi:hypothetical protein